MNPFQEILKDDGFLAVTNTTLKLYGSDKANVLAIMIEQHFRLRVDKHGWFYLSYEEMMERLNARHHTVQTAVQYFLEDGLIVRQRSNMLGKWKYKLVQDRVFALFKKKQVTTENGDSSENLRNVPEGNLRNKEKKKEEKEDKPSSKGKDSLEEGASTDVVAPSNGLRRRKPGIASETKPEEHTDQLLFPSASVEYLFNHWNSLGKPLTSHKIDPTSKTFLAATSYLAKALKKYQMHIIKKAMDDYHKIITAPHTTLVLMRPGVKVSLPEFFKFSEATLERMMHHDTLLTTKSWFLECVLGWEHLEDRFRTHERDIHPKVTEALIQAYAKRVRQENINVTDRNNFIRAARFVVQYHAEHKSKINWNSCLTERNSVAMFAHRLIDALVDDTQDTMLINSAWLCSERTQKIRLHKYLVKIGLLDQSTAPSFAPRREQPPVTERPVRRASRGYDPGYLPGEIE